MQFVTVSSWLHFISIQYTQSLDSSFYCSSPIHKPYSWETITLNVTVCSFSDLDSSLFHLQSLERVSLYWRIHCCHYPRGLFGNGAIFWWLVILLVKMWGRRNGVDMNQDSWKYWEGCHSRVFESVYSCKQSTCVYCHKVLVGKFRSLSKEQGIMEPSDRVVWACSIPISHCCECQSTTTCSDCVHRLFPSGV